MQLSGSNHCTMEFIRGWSLCEIECKVTLFSCIACSVGTGEALYDFGPAAYAFCSRVGRMPGTDTLPYIRWGPHIFVEAVLLASLHACKFQWVNMFVIGEERYPVEGRACAKRTCSCLCFGLRYFFCIILQSCLDFSMPYHAPDSVFTRSRNI